MPQLNLFWFFSNFFLSWLLILIIFLFLVNNLNSAPFNSLPSESSSHNGTPTNNWNW